MTFPITEDDAIVAFDPVTESWIEGEVDSITVSTVAIRHGKKVYTFPRGYVQLTQQALAAKILKHSQEVEALSKKRNAPVEVIVEQQSEEGASKAMPYAASLSMSLQEAAMP